jgi:hypothetical protein
MDNNPAGIAIVLALIVAVVVTWVTGAPARLPNVALGSPVLFHLERVAAPVAGYLLLLVMVTQAWKGDLPSEISTQGLKYATGQGSRKSAIALEELSGENARARIERAELRRRIEALEERH